MCELAQGVGKTCATRTLRVRCTTTWANCIVTTGENPLVVESSGGGAANRVIEIECLPGIHIVCKRVERLQLHDAMAQSSHDARPDALPAALHRKNNAAWLVAMRLDDWILLYREWEAGALG